MKDLEKLNAMEAQLYAYTGATDPEGCAKLKEATEYLAQHATLEVKQRITQFVRDGYDRIAAEVKELAIRERLGDTYEMIPFSYMNNKEWIKWEGFENVKASHTDVVVVLLEDSNGWRILDTLYYKSFKWRFDNKRKDFRIVAYYTVVCLDMCCIRRGDYPKELETCTKGEALVLWGYSDIPGDVVLKLDSILDGRFTFHSSHQIVQCPDYILGYHILPDMWSFSPIV